MTEIALSPAPRALATGSDVSALWLATQQVIASRIAHEYKNTLNGVAVNLEVVRSRLARAASPAGGNAAAATAFAETASGEFERLSAQSEALLALVRPVRAPADVALVAAQLAVLLGLAAGRDGGSLTVEGTDGGGARTMVDGDAVRLVVAQAMLAALEEGAAHQVRCTVTAAPGEGPRLTMTRAGGGAFTLPNDVARVAGQAGVRLAAGDGSGLLLTFPPAAGVDDQAF